MPGSSGELHALREMIAQMQQQLNQVNQQLNQRMEDGFNQVRQEFNQVNQRMDEIGQRIDVAMPTTAPARITTPPPRLVPNMKDFQDLHHVFFYKDSGRGELDSRNKRRLQKINQIVKCVRSFASRFSLSEEQAVERLENTRVCRNLTMDGFREYLTR